MAKTGNVRLGQHWLTDPSILGQIVAQAAPGSDDTVIEIGPGRGHLTAVLLETGSTVIAIEIDPELFSGLEQRLAKPLQTGQLKIELADCRRYDWESLPPDYMIVANIPYYLSAYLLRILTDLSNQPRRAVLLVSAPVAAKIAQGRSLLGCLVQCQYRVSLGPLIAAEAFRPVPAVSGRVLGLDRLGDDRLKPVQDDWPGLVNLIKAGFRQPRRQLKNNFADWNDCAGLIEAGVEIGLNPQARPGDLDPADWAGLYHLWRARQSRR